MVFESSVISWALELAKCLLYHVTFVFLILTDVKLTRSTHIHVICLIFQGYVIHVSKVKPPTRYSSGTFSLAEVNSCCCPSSKPDNCTHTHVCTRTFQYHEFSQSPVYHLSYLCQMSQLYQHVLLINAGFFFSFFFKQRFIVYVTVKKLNLWPKSVRHRQSLLADRKAGECSSNINLFSLHTLAWPKVSYVFFFIVFR